MKTLITPVGTSLFTNYLDENTNGAFGHYYETIKKCSASEWDDYYHEIEELKISSLDFIEREQISASAELQSITKIRDKLQEDLDVHLFASDTIASRLAAEILMDNKVVAPVLGSNISVAFDARADVIEGLQVEDPKAFSNQGMTNLIRKIDEKAGGCWLALAINITGGYKATLPYLTILAQLKHVPLYYNFEDTKEIITVPPIPLVSDWGWIHSYSGILRSCLKTRFSFPSP